MEARIRIELLSDLCVSDGSAYNSMIDNDVCHDRFGFPYIPAKRLRGCLRECALELKDWGENIDIDAMFGIAGKYDNGAKLQIGNAVLQDYEENVKKVEKNVGHPLLHPENVLKTYTYIRTQTSIDYETGVAEDNTLRTTRVIDKGLVFYSDIIVEEKYYGSLEKICKVLRHLGISRTRGLGEVKVKLEKCVSEANTGRSEEKLADSSLSDSCTELEYSFGLVDPVIFKSVNGEESRTKDYIEGSTILGIIAQKLKEASIEYNAFMNIGKLVCSNAYIEIAGERSCEVPGYLYGIKNDGKIYVNKLHEKKDFDYPQLEKKQQEKFKHCYITSKQGVITKKNVETEERYHHRRPEDKSIGRAVSKEGNDSNFYSMESICSGQTFIGTITGTPEQIETIYNLLKDIRYCRIGYSRNSEYGGVEFSIRKIRQNNEKKSQNCKAVLFKLISPAIVYSRKAIASSDPKDLIEEFTYSLLKDKTDNEGDIDNLIDFSDTKYYLKYSRTGGYNITWNKRKPVLSVFDKGTAVLLKLNNEMTVEEGTCFIGERNLEGYGECQVSVFEGENDDLLMGSISNESTQKNSEKLSIGNDKFLNKICDEHLETFIRAEAAKKAVNSEASTEDARSTVSNMILMAEESSDFDIVEDTVYKRYEKSSEQKNKKLEFAKGIIRDVKAEFSDNSLLERFCDSLDITGYSPDTNGLELKYLKAYLMHIKYNIRMKAGENDGK